MFSRTNRISLVALVCAITGLCLMSRTARSDDKPTTAPANLALNKPASASATESDDHAAAKANDGDEDTRWCADGDSTPQWWQVDLQTPATITGISIKWEMDGKVYKYIVEGSADNTKWTTLSDQSNTTVSKQTQTLTLDKPAEGIRYVRIRITGLDDGCWASFFEVKVLGK